MECSICKTSPTPFYLGGMAYRICGACYEGAQNIINSMNKLETENGNAKASTSTNYPTSSCKSLLNASKWVVGLTEKQSFFHEMVDAYRNLTPSDILLKPGYNGSPIAAHIGILSARSKIFKNMLESDTCKAPPLEIIAFPELNHEELEALLEFLYSWSLPQKKLEKHLCPLLLAAHKYEIISLLKFCQNYMLKSLHSRNAIVVLEISDFCSFETIRNDTLSFIVKHSRDIVFSAYYEEFAVKNPYLSVQITRALLMDAKKDGGLMQFRPVLNQVPLKPPFLVPMNNNNISPPSMSSHASHL